MKTLYSVSMAIAGVAIAFGVSGCDGNSQLAAEAVGSWNGTEVNVAGPDTVKAHKKSAFPFPMSKNFNMEPGETMKFTPSFTFARNGNEDGGSFAMSANVVSSTGIDLASVDLPVVASAGSSVSASGTWTATDNDKINLYVDPSSIVIVVDPGSMQLNYLHSHGSGNSSLDSIAGSVALNVEQTFSTKLKTRISSLSELSNVEISGNTMTVKMDGASVIFTKH